MVDAPGFDGVNPSREAATPLRFAGLVLDLDACMLARESGEAVPLTRGEFAVLRMFVSRPGRVISRDALLDAFANRRFEPFDRSVDVLIGKLRRKIESDPKQPRLIVTVPGEGYRFDALRFRPPQIVELADSDTTAKPNGPSPPRLSMVVLPFANIGGDPEQEYFVDGVTESLTTDLSRISGAFVIARNTAFAYKGKAGDVTQIGRELNVRYVLEGSVQRAGGRMRVNVQLIEAETGAHLWAERFDKPVADLFDMQDEIVSHLANRLGQELVRAEAGRAERVANPDSMDHYFLGLAHCHKGPTAEHLDQARSHFDRALELDPNNVGALVWRALADLWWVSSWLSEDQQERFRSAEADLRKALKLRPDDANAHNALGYLRILSNRAVQGISECERALSIDRNLANAHAMIGMGKYLAGRTEETEAHVVEALRISPRDNFAWVWMYIAGRAKVYAGCDEEAVVWLNRSIQLNPNTPVFHFMLAAALAHLGRIEDAREAARAGLELDPSFSSARLRRSMTFSDNPVFLAGRERAYEGMRLAGVPEG
ncbi:MAG: winged helix-turn-helix domain-containing protein [Roseiarcus sp.]|uniref:winged helix-turn-helix domain-containing protein n=1 Tax=Roseiarcus sp. TaxID=1969460 RepID=UPI003C48DD58